MKNCFLLFCTSGSFPTFWDPGPLTCSIVSIHWASIMLNGIPIQSDHKICKKGKNSSSLLPSLVHSLHTFTENLCSNSVHTNLQVENFQTCKSAFGLLQSHLLVKSHQVVQKSDTHCHGHIPDKWVCFVYFIVQKVMEYNSAVFLFQAYAV